MQQNQSRNGWKLNASLLMLGQFASIFGSSMVQYAIAWDLAMRMNSGFIAALGFVAANIPQALVSAYGGWLADRFPRRMLIITPDAASAVVSLALAALYGTGDAGLIAIFMALCIRSIAAGIQSPAVDAYLPHVVPTNHLMRINAINGTLQSIITILAPAAGAALIATLRMPSVLIIDAITAMTGISLLLSIHTAKRTACPNTHNRKPETGKAIRHILEGLDYCRHHATTRRVMITYAICFGICVAPGGLNSVFVNRNFAQDTINLGWMQLTTTPSKLALVELSYGMGAIIGGLIMTAWGGWHNRLISMGIAMAGLTCANILMGASSSGMANSAWTFAISFGLTGFVAPLLLSPSTTLLQETVKPTMLGRVFGLLNTVRTSALPLGLSLIGPLSDMIPIAWVYIGAGILAFPAVAWLLYDTKPA